MTRIFLWQVFKDVKGHNEGRRELSLNFVKASVIRYESVCLQVKAALQTFGIIPEVEVDVTANQNANCEAQNVHQENCKADYIANLISRFDDSLEIEEGSQMTEMSQTLSTESTPSICPKKHEVPVPEVWKKIPSQPISIPTKNIPVLERSAQLKTRNISASNQVMINPRKLLNYRAILPLGIREGFKLKASFEGQLSFVVDPNDFYVIPQFMILSRTALKEQMKMYFERQAGKFKNNVTRFNAETLREIGVENIVGSFWACTFHGKDNWYRIRIMKDSTEQFARVFCVDYGDMQTVKWNALFTLPEELTLLHAAVVHCSVDNLRPPTSSWTKDDATYFTNVLHCSCPREGVTDLKGGTYLTLEIKGMLRSKTHYDVDITEASNVWSTVLSVIVKNPDAYGDIPITTFMVEGGHGRSHGLHLKPKVRDPIIDKLPLCRVEYEGSREDSSSTEGYSPEKPFLSLLKKIKTEPNVSEMKNLSAKDIKKVTDKLQQKSNVTPVKNEMSTKLPQSVKKAFVQENEEEDFPEDDRDLDRFTQSRDPIEALLGYREKKCGRCRFYGTPEGCLNGKYCPFKHIEPEEIPVGTTRDVICFSVSDPEPLIVGAHYVISINSFLSGDRFSISFPVGMIPFESVDHRELLALESREVTIEEAKYLCQSHDMREVYSKIPRERLDSFPAKGQLVAALFSGHFFRGLVIEVFSDTNMVQIELIDFDYLGQRRIPRQDVWSLTSEFTLLPPRALTGHVVLGNDDLKDFRQVFFVVRVLSVGENDDDPVFKISKVYRRLTK